MQLRDMIASILENCDAVSGVTLKNSPNSRELLLDQANGKGRMTFHTLFPGLTLAFIFVNAPVWPESDANSNLKPLLINYCVSGRSELLLDDGSYIYLKENDFCISEQTAQKEYIFPTNRYQGIKIYIDLPLLLQSCGELLKFFSLDLLSLEEHYCGRHKTYLSEADGELEAIFQKLWRLSEKPSVFHLQIDTLALLHRLLNMEIRPPKTCGFYTEIQVELAKRAAQILSEDLRRHIPVRQIAERFSVSETSLKNYFRGVYGQNISAWLREIRMNEAARLLSHTKRPIAEISEQVGYSNQGKFAAVFKKQFGLSPLEYRRACSCAIK
ncbi:MAG: AraC family transcriptional regulator [Eubacteriales bacterium]|nr:AraC family transcriptional regulator [Eubacteriales bacterium]